MPSPFLRAQQAISKKVNRPEPITPVAESYAGDNVPYRGVNDHGVTVADDWRDPHDDMSVRPDGRLVDVYEHDQPEPEPIPVYLVTDDAREDPVFRTQRFTLLAGSVPMRVLGKDNRRTRVRITNFKAGIRLLVCSSQSDILINGYPLIGTDSLEITRAAGDEIWIAPDLGTDVATDIPVGVVWETSVRVG